MDDARIAAMLEEAAERYNEGRYDEAIAVWQQVLASDPHNQKAKEGIRMASLLVQDWEKEGTGPEDLTPVPEEEDLDARVEAGVARVRDLAASGRLDEALEGCRLLEEIAPGAPGVVQLCNQVRARTKSRAAAGSHSSAARGSGSIEPLLQRARDSLAAGRDAEAAAAAREALQRDPANNEAMGILALTGDAGEVAGPSGGAPSVVSDPHATGPVPAAKEPPAGSHLDIEMIDTETADPASGSRHFPVEEAGGTQLLTPQTQSRIEALLAEGQAAFDHGEPQRAIEIWSRIFAMDQTNAEAGGRIDRAKQAIEEQARQVDELFYVAVDAQEAGRIEDARSTLERVLSLSPDHAEARAMLERLAQEAAAPAPSIGLDAQASLEADAEKQARLKAEPQEVFAGSVPLAVPRPEAIRPAARPSRPAGASRPLTPARPVSGGGGLRRLAAAAAGVVVLGGVGLGAYLWFGTEFGSMPEARATVPSSAAPPAPQAQPTPPPPAPPPAARGPLTVVPGGGPPVSDPPPQAPEQAQAPVTGKPDAAALEKEGRTHFQAHRWTQAVLTLRRAMQVDPLGFKSQDLLDQAMAELEKQAQLESEMSAVTKAYGEGDYATVLHKLYRLQQDFPDMSDLDDYIENSWYNWGVLLLRDGAPEEAAEKFSEALDLDRGDPEATRGRDMAQRYRKRPTDEALRAFAAALPLRRLDQP